MLQQVSGAATQLGSVEQLEEVLAGLIGTASTLRLFKDSLAPASDTPRAAFLAEEADFSGYAGVLITWGTPGLDAEGNGIALGDRVEFQNTTGVVANSIGGCWLDVALGGPDFVVPAFYKFADPVAMATALATMGVVPVLTAPNLNGFAIIDS